MNTGSRAVARGLTEEDAVLTIPESHQYLLDSQVGTLATIRPSGGPQMTQVWFSASTTYRATSG